MIETVKGTETSTDGTTRKPVSLTLAERRSCKADNAGSIPVTGSTFTLDENGESPYIIPCKPSKPYLYTDAIATSGCKATIAHPR